MKNGRLLVIIVIGFLAACGGPPPPATPDLPPVEPGLRPGDKINVAVWQEEDLTGEFPVAPNGTVVLPLLGERMVSGIDIQTLEAQLTSEYKEYLENPSISVRGLRRISILGEVREPSLHWIDATISLTDALAMAGGITPNGNRNDIRLIRDGAVLVQSLDAGQVIGTMPIESGDQIQVGGQGWASRNRYFITAGLGMVTSLIVAFVIYGG